MNKCSRCETLTGYVFKHRFGYYVTECNNCKFMGPYANDMSSAITYWNNVHKNFSNIIKNQHACLNCKQNHLQIKLDYLKNLYYIFCPSCRIGISCYKYLYIDILENFNSILENRMNNDELLSTVKILTEKLNSVLAEKEPSKEWQDKIKTIELLQKEKSELNDKISKLNVENNNLKLALNRKQNEDYVQQHDALANKFILLKDKNEELTQENIALKERNKVLEESNSSLRTKINELHTSIKQLILNI